MEFPIVEFRWSDFNDVTKALRMGSEAAMSEKLNHLLPKFCFRDIVVNETIAPMAVSPLKKTSVKCMKGYF